MDSDLVVATVKSHYRWSMGTSGIAHNIIISSRLCISKIYSYFLMFIYEKQLHYNSVQLFNC